LDLIAGHHVVGRVDRGYGIRRAASASGDE
jgi:hypothetical protein